MEQLLSEQQYSFSSRHEMAPATTSVTKIISTGKRCLKALKNFTNVRRRIAAAIVIDNESVKSPAVKPRPDKLSQCPIHLSVTSLEKLDTRSIDTVMTWLDDMNTSQETTDNLVNEKLEELKV